ncbi:hypothetical protein [Flavobacterium terrisoli]|uniref:hypothetical protein n=1 Tax=Flavobacterium terrisoli TaxID=3242195 RepID=UPI002542D21A|nr:hypothetical protein [Flavobacterium buctense]
MKSKIISSVRLLGSGHEYPKNNFKTMSKKLSLIVGLTLFFALSSCEKKVEKTTETIETNTVTTDTVVVKDTVEEKDGTSVKISNDGVDVDSKDVDVEIKK